MITIQAGYALVLDDEPANRDFLERLLQTAGFKVTGAATGADGLRIARSFPELALALVDHELPDAKGLEIISKLREENPESLLVMATMHDDRTLIDEAFNVGADVFLVKPHGFMELYRRLQEIDSNTALLRQVVIDQYGPRPYRGADKRASQEVVRSRPDEEVTRPAALSRTHAVPSLSVDEAKAAPAPVAQPQPVNESMATSANLDATQPNSSVNAPTLSSASKVVEGEKVNESTLVHQPTAAATSASEGGPKTASPQTTPTPAAVQTLKPWVAQPSDNSAKAKGEGDDNDDKSKDATIARRPKGLDLDQK
jgi:DNA-binding response OmpR family regulator